jgi:hypothetical protein
LIIFNRGNQLEAFIAKNNINYLINRNAQVETFIEPKELIHNPHFQDQRKKSLAGLNNDMIDRPIVRIINGLNKLPYCFTIQCCYGHFLFNGQKNPHNLEPLPVATNTITKVEYRIAYIAFCIENSESGRKLLVDIKELTVIDPENIQFCSAEWFWRRQVNTYALQIEPERFKHKDRAILDYREALKIECLIKVK